LPAIEPSGFALLRILSTNTLAERISDSRGEAAAVERNSALELGDSERRERRLTEQDDEWRN